MEATPGLTVLSGWRDLQWSASEIPAMRLLDAASEVDRVFLIFGDSSSSVLVLQLALDGSEVGPPLRLPISGEVYTPLRRNLLTLSSPGHRLLAASVSPRNLIVILVLTWGIGHCKRPSVHSDHQCCLAHAHRDLDSLCR